MKKIEIWDENPLVIRVGREWYAHGLYAVGRNDVVEALEKKDYKRLEEMGWKPGVAVYAVEKVFKLLDYESGKKDETKKRTREYRKAKKWNLQLLGVPDAPRQSKIYYTKINDVHVIYDEDVDLYAMVSGDGKKVWKENVFPRHSVDPKKASERAKGIFDTFMGKKKIFIEMSVVDDTAYVTYDGRVFVYSIVSRTLTFGTRRGVFRGKVSKFPIELDRVEKYVENIHPIVEVKVSPKTGTVEITPWYVKFSKKVNDKTVDIVWDDKNVSVTTSDKNMQVRTTAKIPLKEKFMKHIRVLTAFFDDNNVKGIERWSP